MIARLEVLHLHLRQLFLSAEFLRRIGIFVEDIRTKGHYASFAPFILTNELLNQHCLFVRAGCIGAGPPGHSLPRPAGQKFHAASRE